MNPKIKKVFLIDGIGALLSAVLLGFVLTSFEDVFGMPRNVLFGLSSIAAVFSIYSFSCYFFNFKNLQLKLKLITSANVLYCFLTAYLVFHFYDNLTTLGLLYFILEIIVIFTLVVFERRSI